MIKQGTLSKEILTEMFHKIDKLFDFEIYIHNNNIKDWTIIVDTKKDIYAWGYDVFTVVMNRDDYVWYKFR